MRYERLRIQNRASVRAERGGAVMSYQNRLASKAEIAQAIADRNYWVEIGNELGLRLYGFTDRHSASFRDARGDHIGSVTIDGWVAERIMALKLKTPRRERPETQS